MKPLAIWIALSAVVFGGFVVVTSLVRETTQVFVVVDSSFAMRAVWTKVPDELDRIDGRDHAEFALATEKESIHGFQSELALAGIDAFAPCTDDEIDKIEQYPQIAEADDLIFVTTPGSCDTTKLTGWTIVLLDR